MTTSTTQTRHRRRWRFALAAALSAGIAGLVSTTSSNVSASTETVVIYFAVCDGNGASDTVKIKKINEDGTGLTVVGDTTIANCGDAPETYFSGLAVTKEYSYFSWFRMNGSAAGIGRISNDGSAALNLNYMTLPASSRVSWFQMAPRILNGYLFVNVNNEGAPYEHRILRGSLAAGTLEVCHQVEDLGISGTLSIGVGRDAVYFAKHDSVNNLAKYKIYKTDCQNTSVALNFETANGAAMMHRPFVGPFDADGDGNHINNSNVRTSTLVAESDSTSFVYTITNLGDKDGSGISTVSDMNLANFAEFGAVSPSPANGGFADSQVWGFNYLYYKDVNASKMYRVKPGGVPEQVFAEHIKGTLHHMSVVKETPTTPATPTTQPVTKAPLVINKKGVTGKQIASDLGVTVSKGSKIKLTVAKSSRKVCTVKKSRVVSTKAGATCKVTVTITPKKGKAIKRTTSFTTS